MVMEVRERLRTELDRLSEELGTGGALEDGRMAAGGFPDGDEAGLRARLRRLRQLDAGFPGPEGEFAADRAGYGSAVELEDLATRARVSYTLVTGAVIDLEEDQVTLASPIGAALVGRRAGERVTVALPQGDRRFRIVSLTTLPQMLGMARRRVRASGKA